MSYPPPNPYPPQPVDPQDRTFATLAHAGTLANLLGLWGWVVPLVILLVKPERDMVRRAAVESLNFQISFFVYLAGAFVLSFVLIGLPLLIAIAVMMVIFPIMAAAKASEEQDYRYPLTFRLIK